MFRMVMLIKVTWQLEQLCLHLVISCSQIPQKKEASCRNYFCEGRLLLHNRYTIVKYLHGTPWMFFSKMTLDAYAYSHLGLLRHLTTKQT